MNGGSEVSYACIGATEQTVPITRGEIRCLRGTATTTCTANSYTLLSITWDATLQEGVYDLVGAEVQSANGVFFRVLLTGQVDRPGGICVTSLANRSRFYFTETFRFGSWGTFKESQMPQIELMAGAADASQVVHLFLVKKS